MPNTYKYLVRLREIVAGIGEVTAYVLVGWGTDNQIIIKQAMGNEMPLTDFDSFEEIAKGQLKEHQAETVESELWEILLQKAQKRNPTFVRL